MKKLLFAICIVIYADLTYHKQTDEELNNAASVTTPSYDTVRIDSSNSNPTISIDSSTPCDEKYF
jgi:hypothetical protein